MEERGSVEKTGFVERRSSVEGRGPVKGEALCEDRSCRGERCYGERNSLDGKIPVDRSSPEGRLSEEKATMERSHIMCTKQLSSWTWSLFCRPTTSCLYNLGQGQASY